MQNFKKNKNVFLSKLVHAHPGEKQVKSHPKAHLSDFDRPQFYFQIIAYDS